MPASPDMMCSNSYAAYTKWLEDREIPEVFWERVGTIFGKYRLMGSFQGTPGDVCQINVTVSPSMKWINWGFHIWDSEEVPPISGSQDLTSSDSLEYSAKEFVLERLVEYWHSLQDVG